MNRPASVRYMGFETTVAGRKYRFQVDGDTGTRVFQLVIPHAAFAAREARFQDAPDLCFSRLQKALEADAGLVPGAPEVLTSAELADYRERQTKSPSQRKRSPGPRPA